MNTWIDSSTLTLEAYVKEALTGQAIVLRFKELSANYAGYVIADGQVRAADFPFPSSVDAQLWADQELGIEPKERAVGQ